MGSPAEKAVKQLAEATSPLVKLASFKLPGSPADEEPKLLGLFPVEKKQSVEEKTEAQLQAAEKTQAGAMAEMQADGAKKTAAKPTKRVMFKKLDSRVLPAIAVIILAMVTYYLVILQAETIFGPPAAVVTETVVRRKLCLGPLCLKK